MELKSLKSREAAADILHAFVHAALPGEYSWQVDLQKTDHKGEVWPAVQQGIDVVIQAGQMDIRELLIQHGAFKMEWPMHKLK